MAKIILDIRFYDNDDLCEKTIEQWNYLRDLGYDPIAERFALKLNERKFETGDWDHLYIYFTNRLPPGDIKLRTKGERVASVLVGVNNSDLYEFDREGRQDFELKTISESFYFLSKEQTMDLESVDAVKKLLKMHGENLEIVQKKKTSRSIHAIVSYTVSNQSRLYIFARDDKNGQQGKREIVRLKDPRDARTIASKVLVKEDEIQIHPRKSMKAKWICDQYSQDLYSSDDFIRVSLEELFSNYSCNDLLNRW